MSESSNVGARVGFVPSWRRLLLWVRRYGDYLAGAALLLSAVVVIAAFRAPTLEGRLDPQSVRHDGGFAYVAAAPSLSSRVYRLKDDWMSNPRASQLRLFEDGKSLGPTHASLVDVHQLGAGRYVHWGREIWFSASDGTDPRANARWYEFRSKLSLKRSWVAAGLISLAAALSFWMVAHLTLVRRTLARGHAVWHAALSTWWPIAVTFLRASAAWLFSGFTRLWRRYGGLLLRFPILTMRAVSYLLLLSSGVFLIAALYALFIGWALPTAAPIQWFPLADLAAEREPAFHYLLISLAALGAVAAWCSRLMLASTSALRRDQILFARFMRRWGIYLAVVLFVFSVSAIWAGHTRPGDLNWASIAGLIPFSDANGYLAATHDQAKDGVWNAISLRRPLAAAFRSSLMFFAGFWHAGAVLLLTVLLGCAAYAAARAVGAWRGVYAGLAFFSLSYMAVRTFLPTFLTEPLGLFWALLAIPFFVKALRDGSLQAALIGLGMTTVALSMRPGSMFTIAALCLWLVWRFGRTRLQKLRVVAYAVGIVVSVSMAGYLLQRAYGVGNDLTGSNFAYTLCGLSIGTDWSGCPNRYQEVKTLGSERSVTDYLYRKSVENIVAQPAVLLKRLYVSAVSFAVELPTVLWRGYSWSGGDYPTLKLLFFCVAGIGLVHVALFRREAGEWVFWLLVWLSVAASAAFVHFDDGRRVMTSSYPLLLMFFASGLATPTMLLPAAVKRSYLSVYGWSGLVGTTVVFFAIPLLAHRMSPAPELIRAAGTWSKPNHHVVFGGRRVTGMLVVSDDAPLRTDVPTMTISRFAEFVKLSNVEFYQGLLNPRAPEVPFGFISAPRIEKGVASDYQYIVPPEVMHRRDVAAWVFRVQEWNRKEPYGPYWFFVEQAEAVK